MNDSEREFPLVGQQLDRIAAELDPVVVARLHAARLHAVDAARERGRFEWSGSWLPVSATAAAALVAVTVVLLWWGAPQQPVTVAAEDLEWLVMKDSQDFFEDLEFYHWLGDAGDAG